jgi:hypothetical protein
MYIKGIVRERGKRQRVFTHCLPRLLRIAEVNGRSTVFLSSSLTKSTPALLWCCSGKRVNGVNEYTPPWLPPEPTFSRSSTALRAGLWGHLHAKALPARRQVAFHPRQSCSGRDSGHAQVRPATGRQQAGLVYEASAAPARTPRQQGPRETAPGLCTTAVQLALEYGHVSGDFHRPLAAPIPSGRCRNAPTLRDSQRGPLLT